MAQPGPLYPYRGVMPRIAADVFVAPTAAVIGDVEIGSQSSIWFGCVVRGDSNFIRIGARTNIQDGSIVHVNAGTPFATVIGDDVTVGHGVILHACTVGNRAFVGMGATVLDGAVIEEGGMLAAASLLTPNKRIGRNELWSGSPAKLLRVMDDAERARFALNAAHYAELAGEYLAAFQPED